MPALHGQVIHHQLPTDFAKHPNTPWDALGSIHVDPFIISIDSFSAASNVWSVDADLINLVTSLQPPLPGDILTRRAKGISSIEHSLLIIAFDVASNSTLPEKYHGGVIRAYNVPSGVLQQEVVLHGLVLDQVFTASPSSTYLAAALSRPTYIALYQIHSQGLATFSHPWPHILFPRTRRRRRRISRRLHRRPLPYPADQSLPPHCYLHLDPRGDPDLTRRHPRLARPLRRRPLSSPSRAQPRHTTTATPRAPSTLSHCPPSPQHGSSTSSMVSRS